MPNLKGLAMPSFVTRVELHGASAEDYARLHGAMTAANFHRTITGDDGVQYQLPTAEYFSHGPDLTAPQVRHLRRSGGAIRRAELLGSGLSIRRWRMEIATHQYGRWVVKECS